MKEDIDRRINALEAKQDACYKVWQPMIVERIDRLDRKVDKIDEKLDKFMNDEDWQTFKVYMRRENLKNFRAGSDPVPDEHSTVSEIYMKPLPKFEESDRVINKGTYIKFGGGLTILALAIIYLIMKMNGWL